MAPSKRKAPSTETPTPSLHPLKRQRQHGELQERLSQTLDRLTTESRDVRIQATKDLLQLISTEATSSNGLISTVITRLVRGLSSGRKEARFGFFVALTEVLVCLYGPNGEQDTIQGSPDLDFAFKANEKAADQEGGMVRQEKRNHALGQISFFKAFSESRVLLVNTKRLHHFKTFIRKICEHAGRVPWLREECGLLLCNTLNDLANAGSDFEPFVHEVRTKVEEHGLDKTPEGVAVSLTLKSKFPNLPGMTRLWPDGNPLGPTGRRQLASIMSERYHSEPNNSNAGSEVKDGTWRANLNFAWDLLLDFAINQAIEGDDKGKEADNEYFQQFWLDIIDNGLFCDTSSPERKCWGMQIFTKMVSKGPQWLVSSLFSGNLLRCVSSHARDSTRNLHSLALEACKSIQARGKKDPVLVPGIMRNILLNHFNFDESSRTKTAESLLAVPCDLKTMESLLDVYRDAIKNAPVYIQSSQHYRQHLADMLLHSTKLRQKRQKGESESENPNEASFEETVKAILTIYIEFGYCEPKPTESGPDFPNPAFADESRALYRSRAFSLLSLVFSSREKNLVKLPLYFVGKLQELTDESKALQLCLQAEPKILESLYQAGQLVRNATQEWPNVKRFSMSQMFTAILAAALLLAYGGDEDAISLVDELRASITEDSGSNESCSTEIIGEACLSFMSRPESLFQKLIEGAMTSYTSEVTHKTLKPLLDFLLKEEGLGGQIDTFDALGSEEEESDDDSESSDSGSDKATGEGVSTIPIINPDAIVSMDTSDENDDEDVENEDLENVDADEEEMVAAMEAKAIEILKERSNETEKKAERKAARENMINMKRRILSLLLVYVKAKPANPIGCEILMPALELIRKTSEKSLSGKAAEVLQVYAAGCAKAKKLPRPGELGPSWELLEQIHKEALKGESRVHGSACSRASLLVSKMMVANRKQDYGKVVDIYSQTQKCWVTTKASTQSSFFSDWITWSLEFKKNWNGSRAKSSAASTSRKKVKRRNALGE